MEDFVEYLKSLIQKKDRNTEVPPGRAGARAVYTLVSLCPWGQPTEELHIASKPANYLQDVTPNKYKLWKFMFKRLWLIVRSLLSIAQAPRCFVWSFIYSTCGSASQAILVPRANGCWFYCGRRWRRAPSSPEPLNTVRLDIITISEPPPEGIQRETKRKQSRHLKGDIWFKLSHPLFTWKPRPPFV